MIASLFEIVNVASATHSVVFMAVADLPIGSNADRTQTESANADRTQTESANADRTQTESVNADRTQTESVNADRTQTESANADRTQTEKRIHAASACLSGPVVD